MDQLCHIDDIPEGGCKGLSVNGTSLIAVKQEQQLYLYRNNCPHRGLPLEWLPDQFLDPQKKHIQCATHGALFRINDGYCIHGPCAGQGLIPVPFQIDNDLIIIDSQMM